MELNRRTALVYGLIAAVWAVVLGWQIEEHARVKAAARNNLSNRAKDIANTVGACIRGMQFRGTVLQDRLEPVLRELVEGRTNELVSASELVSIALLNAAGDPVASAGRPIDFGQSEILQQGERWGARSVTFVNPVDLGATLNPQGGTNPTVVLPPFQFPTNAPDGVRGPPRRDPPPPPGEKAGDTNPAFRDREGGRGDRPPPGGGFRRPFWMRGMDDVEYQSLVQERGLHGLALAMSIDPLRDIVRRDLWLRAVILLLATLAAVGAGLAWRNLAKSSELQIRLVRASELNTHLREMNLAAAGLAHETRNPLNIIRGLAQMISRQAGVQAETGAKSRQIVEEADKVAAQLNEFINYSRPREVRRMPLVLGSVVSEVVRALGYDVEEKKVAVRLEGEPLTVEADQQLLRQALFNLILNAIQAVEPGGEIVVAWDRRGASEAALEVRDNGPGVPSDKRTEVFKPYFTAQKQGTGLGLAVVQQIVLAHGWEVECLPNEPRGARFRISHLKVR